MDKYINKIINADCLEFMQEIPDKSIDAIICDLPYGTTACSWDVVIPFDKLWEQYKRIRSPFSPPDLDRRVDSPALSGRGSRPSGRTSG